MKENFEVFSAFKKFKALVEKESGHNIRVMRFNRGSEFTSKEFKVVGISDLSNGSNTNSLKNK